LNSQITMLGNNNTTKQQSNLAPNDSCTSFYGWLATLVYVFQI